MFTKKDVQHIAKLARLSLTDKEIKKYQKEFSKILDYVGALKRVDVSKIKPFNYSFKIENVLRKDEALKFNKKLIDGHLKVKSIL